MSISLFQLSQEQTKQNSRKRILSLVAIASLLLSTTTCLFPSHFKFSVANANTLPDHFALPSGNIYCALITLERNLLRCEIRSLLNPMLPQPATCELDWGFGFLLSEYGKPEILCAGDTIAGSDRILPYNQTWSREGFECFSHRTGLTCKNASGQGFFLSRERWEMF